MATTNTANTHWEGDLMSGSGTTELVSSGVATFDVKWAARAESQKGTTNPEELIAAAHATCFSMALSKGLADNGTTADAIDTQATVTFVPGKGITGIALLCRASVPGIEAGDFAKIAEQTKVNCPVSQALQAVPMTLDAELI